MDAKISINERTVNVLIPAKSEMISLFMTDAFQPKAFWQARLVQRSKYDEAVVELTKTKLPAGALRAKGLVRGTYSSTACAFSLSWSVSGVDNHDLLGIFGATPSSLVLQSGNKLTFQVPADRKPPQRRGAINQESPQQEEPATVDQQMPEKPQDVEIPSTSPVAVPKVTLKQAIDVVNKFKDSMGEHLSLQITMQGKIRALAEYGDVSG